MSKFPVYKTKCEDVNETFDLNDPAERRKYFEAKVGPEIEGIKEYIDEGNTFVGFFLAKKSAGKGTYSKMMREIIGSSRIEHVSVGDVVRATHVEIKNNPAKEGELLSYLRENYRGFISPQEAIDALLGRSTKSLLPTELILTLVRREIEKIGEKGVFIDGFPRNLDQVSYSLYFREIMNLRDDPDFFILIDIPESVIDARMKSRVVCPVCQTSRNVRFLPTKFVRYNKENERFVLLCDNPECEGHGEAVMQEKEGDKLGIEGIRERLNQDHELIQKALNLYGVPKILLRHSVPVDQAADMIDEYEITPEYSYKYDEANDEVEVIEKEWVIEDDERIKSYSLLAAAPVVSFIDQLHDLLV